jgi:hypothetical protein
MPVRSKLFLLIRRSQERKKSLLIQHCEKQEAAKWLNNVITLKLNPLTVKKINKINKLLR